MGREVSGRLLLCTWSGPGSGRIGSGRVGSPVEPRSSRGWVTTRVGSPVGSKSSRGWVGSGRVEDHQSDHHGDPTGDPRGSSRSPVGSPIGLGNQHHHGSPVGSRLSRGWVGSGSCRGRVEGGRVGLFLFQDSKKSRDVTRANRSFARTKTNHSPCRRGPFVCMSQNVHHQNQRRPKPFVSMPKPFPPTIKTTNNQPYDQHHQHPPINNQPHGGVDHTKVVHLFPCPKTFHSPFDVYHPTP